MTAKYDYLIVGSGLFGATFAYRAKQAGKRCLVIEKRPHLGGNIYCEEYSFPAGEGQGGSIHIHKYGAHIFHTNNKEVWDFVNSLVEFNRYTNCPVANYKGELYNLPFNMNTFSQMWGVRTPAEAQAKIEEQRNEAVKEINARHRAQGLPELVASPAGGGWEGASNLEEQALCLVGKDIYFKLIKEYTEKQWGRDCKDLPAFIIKRLPVRMVFDNNYFNDRYQGIPIGGYNKLINALLAPSTSPRRGESVADEGLIDTITNISIPINPPTKGLSEDITSYREQSDPINYGLLKDNARKNRNAPTEAEAAFWSLVKGDNLGVSFRRQHIIGNYIVDFVCLSKKLIVEIDGGYHDDQEQQLEDKRRTEELNQYGFTVLRFTNQEIINDTENAIKKLQLSLWLAERVPLRGGYRGAVVYTGPLDQYFSFSEGSLDWRTVSFKTRVEDTPNYQGNAVVNYTSHDEPYTRVIEHKHFEMFGQEVYNCPKTVISEEYSTEYKPGMEPFYPVNDERNNTLLAKYKELAHQQGILFPEDLIPSSPYGGDRRGAWEGRGGSILFGGRLAQYKYFDMAPIIEQVLNLKF